MTKADLVEAIDGKLKEPQRNIIPIVKEVFSSIEGALAKGEKCAFVGFGVFEVKDRAAREARNPRDPLKTVDIPARKIPMFRASQKLKDKVLAIKKKR
jgi:DNA-binding protein HU-beta